MPTRHDALSTTLALSLALLTAVAFGDTLLELKRVDTNVFVTDAVIQATAGISGWDESSPYSDGEYYAELSDGVYATGNTAVASRDVIGLVYETHSAGWNDQVLNVDLTGGVSDMGSAVANSSSAHVPGFNGGFYVEALGTCVFQPQVPTGYGITKGHLYAELSLIVTTDSANGVTYGTTEVGSLMLEASPSFSLTTSVYIGGNLDAFLATPR